METAKARRTPRREYFALLGSTAGQKASPLCLDWYFGDISLKYPIDSNCSMQETRGIEGSVFALRRPRKAKDLPLAFLATWRFKKRHVCETRKPRILQLPVE
jgi:hypothetical protein